MALFFLYAIIDLSDRFFLVFRQLEPPLKHKRSPGGDDRSDPGATLTSIISIITPSLGIGATNSDFTHVTLLAGSSVCGSTGN